ncbi:MAG: glycosyltransferase family 4 protein [Candidatus Microgenomates bacterium]
MRVALVYDRLNKVGGAERVLVAFSELFPDADWYTSVWDKQGARFSKNWRVNSSFLSKIPYLRLHHEYFPLVMPFIFESFDFSNYDLVISIGSAECKGIITKPATPHLHYCLTPTRYLYSHQAEYLKNPFYQLLAKPLRAWDQVASTRPDIMIAISTQVKKRIKQYYHRDSEIIFPPVDTLRFTKKRIYKSTDLLIDKYFLVVSRLVPYKRIDTLIHTFNTLPHKNLVIAGVGSEMSRLKNLAGQNIKLLGAVDESTLPALYQGAEAFLQANEEDFGISMVEAQASGIPVIAYQAGGASDIVKDGLTGILLPDQTVSSFVTAIDNFDPKRFDKEACRRNATRFEVALWKKKIKERIDKLYAQR